MHHFYSDVSYSINAIRSHDKKSWRNKSFLYAIQALTFLISNTFNNKCYFIRWNLKLKQNFA